MGTERATPTIEIGIVHQVRVIREGLTHCLREEDGFCVTPVSYDDGFPTGEIQQPSLDLALLEVYSESESLEARIQNVKRRFSDPKVVALGVANTNGDILACIEAGAAGYTLENDSMAELVETIRSVHVGGMHCPPEISALLFERLASFRRELGPRQDHKLKNFTRRETEILQLVADDLSNKEIASLLGLEVQTVKNYVHNILEKLRVQNRRDAATYARSCGLVEAPTR
ncbi:MAG: response regulator transcription factor [Chloroflexota bacterium]|nr:response regulator transcription factor [Chloroflexota bacterium]